MRKQPPEPPPIGNWYPLGGNLESLVLTTNLAFKEWPLVFPNATCTTALIDRVIHHADVIAIRGKSYRLREAGALVAADDDLPRTKPTKS